jgi:hypothetical protein
MRVKLTHGLFLAGLLVFGTHGASWADEVAGEDHLFLSVEIGTQVSDIFHIADPVVNGSVVSVLPPRRPKTLAAAKPTQNKQLFVAATAREYRVAQVALQVRSQPLFWMTVGNGF